MLGVGEPWEGGVMADGPGGGHKVHYLRSRLRNVDDHDIVMFVDGYDVVINDNQEELIKRLNNLVLMLYLVLNSIWHDISIADLTKYIQGTDIK